VFRILKFNINLIQYALKYNYHVEYFIWVYLRSLNQNGLHDISALDNYKLHKSTIKRKLKDNIFFKVNKSKIILSSEKKLNIELSKKEFTVDFHEISLFANKNATQSGNSIKGWNSTLIKYLLICIYSCQYDFERPYALNLIEEDTYISASTIQRAIKVFAIEKKFIKQEKFSSRSYAFRDSWHCFSPNFYRMPVGKIKISR
jgi:hypothetical protein